MRSVLTFFSTLAFAVMTSAGLAALIPWLSGRSADTLLGGTGGLHFESVLLGVVLGLAVGSLARLNWADFPRRLITWVLIRERQFFYYGLIGCCIGVLLFY
jgi:hypothetical protein